MRSLSDLAGGSGQGNRIEVSFRLAVDNAAAVVRALLRTMREQPGEPDCARRTAAA